MHRLTELGIKYNTDKASYHGFTDVYGPFFSKYVSPAILEIGLYNGGSIRMMNEYYENRCKIIGLDNGTQLGFTSNDTSNLEIVIGDQSNENDLSYCIDLQPCFDIIIDDGSHFMSHQQISFEYLFNFLNPGGIYIIEDLHTSFCEEHYNPTKILTTYEFVKSLKSGEYAETPHISKSKFSNYVSQISEVVLERTISRNPTGELCKDDSITSVIKKR
jgi:hypothetical protein